MGKRPAGGAASLARMLNVSLAQEDVTVVQQLSLQEVHADPEQVRRHFDPVALEGLSASIQKVGVQQPIQVQPRAEGGYWIVTGERRFRASQLAGKDTIPAVVLSAQSAEQARTLQLIENSQREDLDEYTQTLSMVEILSLVYHKPVAELVQWLNSLSNAASEDALQQRSEVEDHIRALHARLSFLGFVKNRLPLLNLPLDLREALQQGRLEYTKARLLSRIKEEKPRVALLHECLDQGLSHEQLKKRVDQLLQKPKPTEDPVTAFLKGKDHKRYLRLNQEKRAQVEARLREVAELLKG